MNVYSFLLCLIFFGFEALSLNVNASYDCHNRPMHVYMKINENNDVVIAVVKKDKFMQCAVVGEICSPQSCIRLKVDGKDGVKSAYNKVSGWYVAEIPLVNKNSTPAFNLILHVLDKGHATPETITVTVKPENLSHDYQLIHRSRFLKEEWQQNY